MSDDNITTRQIQDTHYPDGRQVDIKPLLCVVEDILQRSTLAGTIDAPVDTSSIGMIDQALAYTVNKISCEISCKCSGDGGANASTMALLKTLSSYSWEAKVVLILAAFAVNYGEFCLVEQLYTTNELAKSIAILKQLPEISERDESLSTVIKNMMDITKCIIEFTKLPAQYISHDTPALADAWACIPNAVYWTIRSIVACSSQITNLVHLGNGYRSSANETWQKVVNIHIKLAKQLDLCKEHIGLRRQKEAYDNLIRLFGTTDRINQMEVLKAVICARTEVQLPLYDGYSTKTTVKLEVLTRKHVLLLISDLEISNEEVSMLAQMCSSNPRRQYEVVWLPVVDQSTPWTVEKQNERFNKLKCESMPWYSLHDLELLEPWVIKYIKEVWHFTKKPILVVLDQQGRVVNENALHMMWIWGSAAFPFTRDQEHALWTREQNWKLDLLVDCIDPKIKTWMEKKELICLYGGENMEWLEKFTSSAQTVSKTMKLVYVGKSNPKERVKKNNGIIQHRKLGYIWEDLTLIWFFWARLESMWYSKMQCGKTVQNDLIMHEIMKMLSFDGSDQGWAVITDGSTEMVKAKGELILTSFTQVDKWKVPVDNGTKGFVTALNDHLKGLQIAAPHHCNRLILPGTAGSIPGMVNCVECHKPMERYIMYRCCTD